MFDVRIETPAWEDEFRDLVWRGYGVMDSEWRPVVLDCPGSFPVTS